ncbi:hypothetical protein CGMCC3_g13402 [Colletotrichum fructicola]|uniref:Uncharacterized protein n=1 Tax=Colletotrichum asianum TaxID=702518 RepID=A0A8H3W6B1_9PEZI|nr:uncharacterized protein CGMCC3_g13402 [Colletotrichum fructicola]KAE9570493.1 hypothetical protein CGMCC3_g13402 [Colletotrichum fructicola]KAF0319986.1 hypothetical protein GQ607_012754 [Colletotrichum asianum]
MCYRRNVRYKCMKCGRIHHTRITSRRTCSKRRETGSCGGTDNLAAGTVSRGYCNNCGRHSSDAYTSDSYDS